MAVNSTARRIIYDGNGVIYTFPYTFKITADSDLVVIHTNTLGVDTVWELNKQYSVTGAKSENGGNVVITKTPTNYTPAEGTKLTIYRELTILQESDYIENAPLHASTLEDDFDKGIMIDQQLADDFSRCLSTPLTDDFPDLELPSSGDRANTILTFDSDGNVLVQSMADADLISSGTINMVPVYTTEHGLGASTITIIDGVITAVSGTCSGTSNQWSESYTWGDHSAQGYVKADGSIPFTNTVSGVTPTDEAHLSTKGYVDDQIAAVSLKTDHGLLTGLSDDDHTQYHTDNRGDARYYTQSQITTISGDIVAQIPSIDGYATELYVDTVSGALHSEIENIDLTNYYTKEETTTISGDIVAQIPTDYISDAEMTTISGDIVNEIVDYFSMLVAMRGSM